MTLPKTFLLLAAIFGALAVVAGAFGAHALQDRLSPPRLQTWETAVRYQMWHAIAMIGIAILLGQRSSAALAVGGWLFVAGILIFSGSLYILCLTGVSQWGAVTPLGGVSFIAGWIAMASAAMKL